MKETGRYYLLEHAQLGDFPSFFWLFLFAVSSSAIPWSRIYMEVAF